MYVGRIVAVGQNSAGRNAAAYRVSSRSFPNRQAVDLNGTIAIMPRPGAEDDLRKNPYIAYNALRLVEVRMVQKWAVVANGSHTDPITEKIAAGLPPRDALALSLLALDYEKDSYNTPRIAAVVPHRGDAAWLGIVRHDALVVKEVALRPGHAWYIATYEANDVRDTQTSPFEARTAGDAARFLVDGGAFRDLEKPVTSAAALANETGFALGTHMV
ncbi:MAG: IMP cyclohydrolase [SAR202 cluster bacterium]|nr:IMP cyclohydrolase [SAR202 cluster bacterium]